MKTKLMIAAWAVALAIGSAAMAEEKLPRANSTDRTKFDCRETVAVRTYREDVRGREYVLYEIRECPHKEQMAAGKCVSSFWRGMRCKE